MSAQRRTALASVAAAAALVALKLAVGLSAHSLGLVSEAVHSGTDLVAALLTFLALGVSGRPADLSHQYGHGKAEHLAALAEATFLSLASVLIAVRALQRLLGVGPPRVHASGYVLATVDRRDRGRREPREHLLRMAGAPAAPLSPRTRSTSRATSQARWPCWSGSCSCAHGHPDGDAYAALLVAVLVLLAAARLIRTNVDVLMDRAPAGAELAARAAIDALRPRVELRRLRMRQAGGRQFADVVIGVAPSSPVGQGHAAADAVEEAVERALPGSDVVVHVEPGAASDLRERAHAAAASVPGVHEIHNVSLVEIDGRNELSLHVKLPGRDAGSPRPTRSPSSSRRRSGRRCRRSTPSGRTSSR